MSKLIELEPIISVIGTLAALRSGGINPEKLTAEGWSEAFTGTDGEITTPPITFAEFEVMLQERTVVAAAEQYKFDRVYPSIEDQLDSLFHKGLEGWKADIQAAKDAFPKPE